MPTPNLNAITNTTPKTLVSTQLALNDNAVYTVPNNRAAKIATFLLHNTGAATVTLRVSHVPAGGAVDGTHRIVTVTLAPDETAAFPELAGAWLGAGDFLSVNASAAAAVNVVVTGLEFA